MPLSKVTLNLQTFGMQEAIIMEMKWGYQFKICSEKYPFAHNWHEGYN